MQATLLKSNGRNGGRVGATGNNHISARGKLVSNLNEVIFSSDDLSFILNGFEFFIFLFGFLFQLWFDLMRKN